MKYRNEKPDLYALLDSTRLSADQRREAIAHIQQAEAGMDIIFSAVDVFRQVVSGMARGWNAGTSGKWSKYLLRHRAHAESDPRTPC